MRHLPTAILLGLLAGPVAAQEPPEPVARHAPFVEKVEVRVRSILVFATGADGKPLASPLTPADLQVLENATPVEILAVEPVRGAPGSAAGAPASPGSESDAPHASEVATPQYLYLDTATLNLRSIRLVADAVLANLDRILATGTLEIVVADATPRVVLASTRNAESIRSSLDELSSSLPGKERLLTVRRDALREIRNAQYSARSAMASNVRAHVRSAAEHEIALLRSSLNRLESWAADRSDARAGILYYGNDGFDMNPIEIYRDTISSQDAALRQEIMQLDSEYGSEVSKMLVRAESTIAGKGLTTVPLALGGTNAEFSGSAANMGIKGAGAIRQPLDSAPLFYYARPMEPLRLVADATGGEVVSTSSRFGSVLDRIGAGYLVTLRVQAQPDGRPHPLVVKAARPGLTVRASRYLLTGAPRALSVQRAVRVLEGSEKPAEVPLLATIVDPARTPSGRMGGMLRIAANFASLPDINGEGEAAPVSLRLSLAVDLADGEPFTSSEEVDWRPESTSWRFQLPVTWPHEARRIAVLVEELSTGLSGSAIVAIPGAP